MRINLWQFIIGIAIILSLILTFAGEFEYVFYILLGITLYYLWDQDPDFFRNNQRGLIIFFSFYIAYRFGILYSVRLYLIDFWFYWRTEKWFLFFFGHALFLSAIASLILIAKDIPMWRWPGFILITAFFGSLTYTIVHFNKVDYVGYDKENWSSTTNVGNHQWLDFLLKPEERILVKDPDGNLIVVERVDEHSYPIATPLSKHPVREKVEQILFYELKDTEFNDKNLNAGYFSIRGIDGDGGVHLRQSPK